MPLVWRMSGRHAWVTSASRFTGARVDSYLDGQGLYRQPLCSSERSVGDGYGYERARAVLSCTTRRVCALRPRSRSCCAIQHGIIMSALCPGAAGP